MNKRALVLMLLICLINTFLIEGCSTQTSSQSIVDVGSLSQMIDKKEKNKKQDSPKMVELKNGVIIYKDKTITSDDDSLASKKIEFGPKKINFN